MRGYPFGSVQEEQMLLCISLVGRYLEAKVKNLKTKLMAEVQAMQPDEMLRLPHARTYGTECGEIRMSWKTLRARRRAAEGKTRSLRREAFAGSGRNGDFLLLLLHLLDFTWNGLGGLGSAD